MPRLAETRSAAAAHDILPFHDPDYGEAIAEAERLAKDRELEAAARRRLGEALDEHAVRAAEWARVEALLRDMAMLASRGRRLQARARKEKVPPTLLAGAADWRAANGRFVEDALSGLDDRDLREQGHWRSRPADLQRIEAAVATANRDRHVPDADR